MIVNFLTIFPEMFREFIQSGILKKAADKGLIELNTINIRDYTRDKHNRVDDYPFGGGAGMLFMAQPLFSCFEDLQSVYGTQKTINLYASPCGTKLKQTFAAGLAEYECINILCGHYEGVDQRVIDRFIDEEVSIGDYVLSGGELPAMVIADCVLRLVPGVLSNTDSVKEESFSDGLLEYPQYTRPAVYDGMDVPEVLLSGNHKRIKEWKLENALVKTAKRRPDLLQQRSLTPQELSMLAKNNIELDYE